ncbi:hypothetical protein ACLOJK_024990 [Asimina triloba]
MSGKWLPSVSLTGSGRPVFLPGEVECSLISSVDIDFDEEDQNSNLFPSYKSGLSILTTHRLLWISESSGPDPAKTASLNLASVVHVFPLKRSIKSMFSSPRIRVQIDGRVAGIGPGTVSTGVVITLVLRGKKTDPEAFFGRILEVVRSRAWESSSAAASDSRENGGEDVSSGRSKRSVVGVTGILRKEQELLQSTDRSLEEAFHDLNALMSKAKEMVLLAEKMRLKLLSGSTGQSSATNDEEMGSKQEMQDWLLSVGIASPVTKEAAGALYHQQLSRQIGLAGSTSPDRGSIIIWKQVPVMLRKFDSGVMVIQNKAHSDEEVFARIKALALKPDALRAGISPNDAAMTLGIAPALAKEQLLAAESKGLLCRDISPEGFRFYINIFRETDPSNIHMVKDHGFFSSWVSAVLASA